MNSREKGKRGERQWRDELRANGYHARRGQQFAGGSDSPDVICEALAWVHFEVKAVERLNIEDAMEQARRDAGCKSPVVAHRRRHRRWLVTMNSELFFELLREFQPQPAAKISTPHPQYLGTPSPPAPLPIRLGEGGDGPIEAERVTARME